MAEFDAQEAHEQSPAFPPMYHSGFHAGERTALIIVYRAMGLPMPDDDKETEWFFEKIKESIGERSGD